MIYALISVLLNSFAQLTVKKATTINPGTLLLLIKNPYLYMTAMFYMTSIVTWFLALSRLQVSVAYPLQALGYIVVSLTATYVFKEHINIINWIGLFLILAGVILTQTGRP
ncbi:EmrE Membrane transporters of cations and cationic drugs [Candidatus Nanopelagicaceae bacterium]